MSMSLGSDASGKGASKKDAIRKGAALAALVLATLGMPGKASAIQKPPGGTCPSGTIDDPHDPNECILEDITNEPPVQSLASPAPRVA